MKKKTIKILWKQKIFDSISCMQRSFKSLKAFTEIGLRVSEVGRMQVDSSLPKCPFIGKEKESMMDLEMQWPIRIMTIKYISFIYHRNFLFCHFSIFRRFRGHPLITSREFCDVWPLPRLMSQVVTLYLYPPHLLWCHSFFIY